MPRQTAIAIRCLVSVCLLALAVEAVGFVPTLVVSALLVPALLAPSYLAVVTPWLVSIDLHEHRLPNRLVVPGIAIGGVSCAGEWLASGRPPLVPLVAGAGYAGFLLLLHLVGGMGMGDVKLGVVPGLASWSASVAVLSPVIAFLGGGFAAAVLLAAGRRGRRIAFGPWLLGGYWLAVAIVATLRIWR